MNQRWVVKQSPFGYYSTRLAKLDLERFGREVVSPENLDEPYYSTDNTLKKSKSPLQEVFEMEGEFHKLLNGGHMLTIPLPNTSVPSERIFEVTKEIVRNTELGLYGFGRQLTHCLNCQTNNVGILQKCSSCGSSTNQILNFDRDNGPEHLIENRLLVQREKSPHQWVLGIQ
jgi:anaerobic ribonucleoside-triphosphate reductase